MMGTYHQRGLVKGGSATTAYAFFQRAADMGSPSAMTFLGDKLGGAYDARDGSFWGNSSIAIEMLQCAVSQGHGDAAYELGLLQSSGYSVEAKALALKTFHDGVKLGCAKCSKMLFVDFDGAELATGRNVVGYVDIRRSSVGGPVQPVEPASLRGSGTSVPRCTAPASGCRARRRTLDLAGQPELAARFRCP
jgi:uncharacterized protein